MPSTLTIRKKVDDKKTIWVHSADLFESIHTSRVVTAKELSDILKEGKIILTQRKNFLSDASFRNLKFFFSKLSDRKPIPAICPEDQFSRYCKSDRELKDEWKKVFGAVVETGGSRIFKPDNFLAPLAKEHQSLLINTPIFNHDDWFYTAFNLLTKRRIDYFMVWHENNYHLIS